VSRTLDRHPCLHPTHRAGRLLRLGLLILGVTLLAIWNPVASPGPRLCLLRNACALPCPLCGLTRGLALCLHGRLAEAVVLNPLVLVLVPLLIVLTVKWIFEYLAGCAVAVRGPAWLGRTVLLLANLAIVLAWVYLLGWRREDDFASSWLGKLWGLLRG
jgi:hypothetical protein